MKRLVPYLFFLGLSTQLDLGKFGASWYKKMKKPKDQSTLKRLVNNMDISNEGQSIRMLRTTFQSRLDGQHFVVEACGVGYWQ